MSIKSLAAKVSSSHPSLPASTVTSILRAALTAMKEEITATPSGVVRFPLLGSFHVALRKKSAEAGDEAAETSRIVFKLAKETTSADGAGEVAEPKSKAERQVKRAAHAVKKAERETARHARGPKSEQKLK